MLTLTDTHTALTNHPAFIHVEEHQDICGVTLAHSYTYMSRDTHVFDLWVESYLLDTLLITTRYGDDLEGTELVKLNEHPNDNHMQLVMSTISEMCNIQ